MCEEFDIRTLPTKVVSDTRCSLVVKKLNEKRKKAHDEIIHLMKEQMREVNADIDKQIHSKTINLEKRLAELNTAINELFSSLRNTNENEFVMENISFSEANMKVTNTKRLQLELVDEYYNFLNSTEKGRSDKFKEILRETYEKAVENGYNLPFKNWEYFENEILSINKITLNNHQNNSEVYKNLKLQIENNVKKWTQELFEIKEILKTILQSVARKSVAKFRDRMKSIPDESSDDDLRRELKHIKSYHSNLRLSSCFSIVPVSMEDIEVWLTDVQKSLAAIDQSAKNVVSIYKSIIIVLYNRFFSDMEDLKKSMLKTGIVDKANIKDIQCDIYTPTIDELNAQYKNEIGKLQDVWAESLDKMNQGVQDTYKFLRGAAGLWDRHFQRTEFVQGLVIHDVENMMEKNNRLNMPFEIKLNIILDKMRQGSTEKKLDKLLEEVKTILNDMRSSYTAQGGSEIQVAQKYRQMVDFEVEVLMTEIKRYLILHPPDEERDPKKQRRRASQIEEVVVDPKEAFLPLQILYCMFQVDALKNWMFGLWEAVNQYVSVGKAEIMVIADKWVDKHVERINERLAVKLAFLLPRYHNIQCSVYEKRRTELVRHSERFNSHKMAAENEIKSLKQTLVDNEQKFISIVSDYETTTEDIINRAMKPQKIYQIRGFINILEPVFKHKQQLLEDLTTEFKTIGQEFSRRLKIANYKYINSIKLFSEGGNFSVEEVELYFKGIQKLDETTTKQLDNLYKESESKCNYYNSLLDKKNSEVNAKVTELIKEIEHNENTVKLIRVSQNRIRDEVVLLKISMRKVDTMMWKLVKQSPHHLGNKRYLDQFSDDFEAIVENANSLFDRLWHPEPIVLYALSPDATESKRNRADKLFYHKLENDNTFVSALNNILNASFENIESHAKEFYSKHHHFHLDNEIIRHKHEDFISDVLEKYKSFLIQCEISWTENCSEVLSLLDDFLKYKRHYLKSFEHYLCKRGYDEVQKAVDTIMQDLNELKTRTRENLKKMYNKLKVCYGHPSNKVLLDNLEVEYNRCFHENREKFSNILDPYMVTLRDINENLINTYEECDEKLSVMFEDSRLFDLKENLSIQLNQKLGLLQQVAKIDYNHNSLLNTKRTTPNQNISKQVVSYMVNKCASCLNINRFEDSIVASTSSTETDFESTDFVYELKVNYEINSRKISSFVEEYLINYINEFNEIWINEIENIKNLYKVRYDKTDIF